MAVFLYVVCLQRQKSSVSVLEALAAIDGAIVVGLKGNLAVLTALCAHSGEHLAGATLATACLTGSAAIAASLRLVGEALLGVELLLAGGENEFASAILADNGLVSVHVITSISLAHFLRIIHIIQPFIHFVKTFFEINVNFLKFSSQIAQIHPHIMQFTVHIYPCNVLNRQKREKPRQKRTSHKEVSKLYCKDRRPRLSEKTKI